MSSIDPATQTWSPLADMIDLRWYGLAATLPDNTVFASFAKYAGSRTEVSNPATNTRSPRYNADADTQLFEQNVINAAPNPTGAIDTPELPHRGDAAGRRLPRAVRRRPGTATT
ncbi:MAG: hypothetical protein IPK00_23635 [Deltaproteobacteria bacterium]|nr:hypothetical protein [Deltaproteobacteria bacterium]